MKKLHTIAKLILISILVSCSENKKIYHEFEPTASDFSIVKWNIEKRILPEYFLIETIDWNGRVIELKFFKKNKIITNRLCYLVPWIKFEYPNDTTITQFNLEENGNLISGLECEVPSKVTYTLNKSQTLILESIPEYQIDFKHYMDKGWTNESILKAMELLEENQNPYQTIDYFSKSKSKLNGKYPVSKNFDIDDYYFNQLEKQEIEKAFQNY